MGKSKLIYAVYLFLACFFWSPAFTPLNNLGRGDWDQHFFYYHSFFRSLYEYGQLPFWNPWYCGGNVLWANPQIAMFSPVYLLMPFMSLALSMKINIVLHYMLSFVGMHLLLTRCFGLRSAPLIVFLNCVSTLSGANVFHIDTGHSTFMPFLYAPLAAYFLYTSLTTGKLRRAVYGAIVSALMLLNGGFYAFLMTMVIFAAWVVLIALARWSWRPLVVGGVFFALAGLYTAPKVLPAYKFTSNPAFLETRELGRPEATSNAMLIEAFTNTQQGRQTRYSGIDGFWHERAAYIGTFALAAIFASIVAILAYAMGGGVAVQGLTVALLALLLYLLCLGDFSDFAPYTYLRQLPAYDRLRIPTRYVLLFPLFGALAVAYVASTFSELRWPAPARWFGYALLLLSTMDLVYRNRTLVYETFPNPPLKEELHFFSAPNRYSFDEQRVSSRESDSFMLRTAARGASAIDCYEPVQAKKTCKPIMPLLYTNGQAVVDDFYFGPSAISFAVHDVKPGAKLYLNQNFMSGWSGSGRELLQDPETRLASLDLTATDQGRMTLSYFPPGLIPGLAAFVLAIALSIALYGRRIELNPKPDL